MSEGLEQSQDRVVSLTISEEELPGSSSAPVTPAGANTRMRRRASVQLLDSYSPVDACFSAPCAGNEHVSVGTEGNDSPPERPRIDGQQGRMARASLIEAALYENAPLRVTSHGGAVQPQADPPNHSSGVCDAVIRLLGPVLRRLDVLYHRTAFKDAEMEVQFRADCWRRSYMPFKYACFLGFAWCLGRAILVHLRIWIGKEMYTKCCERVWSLEDLLEEDLPKHAGSLYFETIASFIGTISNLGYLNSNCSVFALKLCWPGYHNLDDNHRMSIVGEVVLVSSALLIGHVAVSNYWWGGSKDFYTVLQLLWLGVTYPVLLQWQQRHTLLFMSQAFPVSLISVAIRSSSRTAATSQIAGIYGNLFFAWMMIVFSAFFITARKESSQRSMFVAQTVEDQFRMVLKEVLEQLLPEKVMDGLLTEVEKNGKVSAFADSYPAVSVLFIRINADEACLGASDLVAELNAVYTFLDDLVSKHRDTLKIETVGEEYMVASGCPEPCSRNAYAIGMLALEVQMSLENFQWSSGVPVKTRMGIHSGELVAGVAGEQAPRFRLFGDTVNTASRMKSKAQDGMICVSKAAKDLMAPFFENGPSNPRLHHFLGIGGKLTCLGEKEVKGKGLVEIWELSLAETDENPGAWPSLAAEPSLAPNGNAITGEARNGHESMFGILARLKENDGFSGSGMSSGSGSTTNMTRRTVQKIVKKAIATGEHEVWNLVEIPPSASLAFSRMPPFQFYTMEVGRSFTMVRSKILSKNWKQLTAIVLASFLIIIVGEVISVENATNLNLPRAQDVRALVAVLLSVGSVSIACMCLIMVRSIQAVTWMVAPLKAVFFTTTICAMLLPGIISKEVLDTHFSIWRIASESAFHHITSIFLLSSIFLSDSSTLCTVINLAYIIAKIFLFEAGRFRSNDVLAWGLMLAQLWWNDYLDRVCFQAVYTSVRIRVFLERLCQNLLPAHVLVKAFRQQQQNGSQVIGKDFFLAKNHLCGHLFADVAGFTTVCSSMAPAAAFVMISELFQELDGLCTKWGINKIETIGDAYWCSTPLEQDAGKKDMINLVRMAMEMQELLDQKPAINGTKLKMRIGVHYGPCMGCVVGTRAPRYHLFGPAIDVVQQLEQAGTTDGIVLSWAALRNCLGVEPYDIDEAADLWSKKIGHTGDGQSLLPDTFATKYSLESSRLEQLEKIFSVQKGKQGDSLSPMQNVVPVCVIAKGGWSQVT